MTATAAHRTPPKLASATRTTARVVVTLTGEDGTRPEDDTCVALADAIGKARSKHPQVIAGGFIARGIGPKYRTVDMSVVVYLPDDLDRERVGRFCSAVKRAVYAAGDLDLDRESREVGRGRRTLAREMSVVLRTSQKS